MKDLFRAAVIGCGKIGWEFQEDPGAERFGVCTHAAAWSSLENVRLVAVADADPARARRCAERWRVPAVFQDVEQLLNEAQPHVVSVATPDGSHFSVARQCLEHPSVKAVLVEKPLAATLAEATQLDALARRLNKKIVVNYIRRFCPRYQSVRASIKSGEYGEIRLARILYTKGLRHNGSHALDLMQFWFSRLELRNAETPALAAVHSESDPDPAMDVTFAVGKRGKGVLHSLPFEDYTVFEIDLSFEKGRLVFTESGDTLETYLPVVDRPFAGYRGLERGPRQEGCLRDYLLHAGRHVIELLEGKTENTSDAASSVSLLQQFEAVAPPIR